MKLLSAQQMFALEQQAMKRTGIPSLVLMENAGRGVVDIMQRYLGPCKESFCPVFIGPGNNGGDGLVVGRHLHLQGCQPVFFILCNDDTIKNDARVNFEIVHAMGLPCHSLTTEKDTAKIPQYLERYLQQGQPCYGIVDAIFGIGLHRDITGHYQQTVLAINQLSQQLIPGQRIPVCAVDIPSGLHADSGEIMGCAVTADYTVTFGYAKPGHFLANGKAIAGKVDITDIGIPLMDLEKRAAPDIRLITASTLDSAKNRLQRHPISHKGNHGHVLIIAGSHGSTGAAILAAKGALRMGAGLVTITSTQENNATLQMAVPEAMTMPLAASTEFLSSKDWPQLKKNLAKYDALVIGPGLGLHPETMELVLHLFHEAETPAIIDADALNTLAGCRNKLHSPRGPRIYTPHPGELGRLLKCSAKEITTDYLSAAEKAYRIFKSKRYPTIMLVKGGSTVVYDGESFFINTTGNPAMATGGMGDVLSGVIAALVSQALSPMTAASCGTFLHGLAADILVQQTGVGLYASELADALPAARKQLLQGAFQNCFR